MAVFTTYFFFVVFVEVHKEPEVTLDIGVVTGEHAQEDGVNVFYGIPYARPPVGPLRFRAPKPLPQSSRVLDGRNMRYPCIQSSYYQGNRTIIDAKNTTEDCLHLNIFSPRAERELFGTAVVLNPVIVVLFGWNFASGSNSFYFANAAYFARITNAVIVVPNYRLGQFGFLFGYETGAAGNMGLLDQVRRLIVITWLC